MQLLNKLLEKKPQVIKAYVNVGLHAAFFTTKAVGVYMRHLITVQGLNPDEEPGTRARKEMQDALNSAFTYRHESSFDNDFDFSWAHKKWAENHKKLEDLNMSEKEFVDSTDLSRVDDAPVLDIEEPLAVGSVELDEENFGTVHPRATQTEKQREAARDKKLDEMALARLRELEKLLEEGVGEGDDLPFAPAPDVKKMVARGKDLKELSELIKEENNLESVKKTAEKATEILNSLKTRRASKFKGNFKRTK